MKNLSAWFLVLGDIACIFVLSVVLGLGSILLPDSLIWTAFWGLSALFVICWLMIGAVFKNFDPEQSVGLFLRNALLTWSAAFIVSKLITYAIEYSLSGTTHGVPVYSLEGLMVEWLAGVLFVAAWRFAYKVYYAILARSAKSVLRKLTIAATTLFSIFVLTIFLIYAFVNIGSAWQIVNSNELNGPRAAIVFGAGLSVNNEPSGVLYERVALSTQLYHSGKVDTIVMSGGLDGAGNSEAEAMKKIAIDSGVPQQNIILDNEGDRTYHSCYTAKNTYGLQRAVLISQRYHLPRALFICNHLGIDSVGISSDRGIDSPAAVFNWNLREFFATVKSVMDVFILKPTFTQ